MAKKDIFFFYFFLPVSEEHVKETDSPSSKGPRSLAVTSEPPLRGSKTFGGSGGTVKEEEKKREKSFF